MTPDYLTISSFRELKDYLLAVRPQANGCPVVKYDITFQDNEGLVRQKLKLHSGQTLWSFYGYLEDVKHNVALGLLEGSNDPKGF